MANVFGVCGHCKSKDREKEEYPCDECQFSPESGYTYFVWDEEGE